MLINHTNYTTTLKQSSTARDASPDGNVFFDVDNNRIQLIGVDELPTVDFGSGPVTNPLNNSDGITMRGIYNFENQRRVADEILRRYKRGTDGDYRFSGAFNFVNGIKLDGTDRQKIRASGFIEYADSNDGHTDVDRIYHGVRSLIDIQATTQPYYTFETATDEATLQAATWTDFSRLGDINEVVQVYGSTANGDTGTTDFDYTDHILSVRVRSWGYLPGETTSVATGVTEFSGFSSGYGVGESRNAQNVYDLADVYGAGQISPWTGMTLEKLTTPQTETGFNEADGSFTWVLHNTAGGSAEECAAYLDAVILQDSDIDAGPGTYNGKNGRVWYTRSAAGKIVTISIDGEGLFIEGLSAAEKQNAILTADNGDEKTYPYFPSCEITVGAAAVADTNAWYQVFYVDGAGAADFNTATAVTVNDADGNPVKGNVSTDAVGEKIAFTFDYDGNTQAGLPAGVDKAMVVLVEGDGGCAQDLTLFTMTRTAVVSVTCAPAVDNNA